MLIFVILALSATSQAIFFGGGGGGDSCCCSCGTPQPPSCGCRLQCPAPAPCPACAQQVCPPPPTAYCPQVQPVYVPSQSGGFGGYASPPTRGGFVAPSIEYPTGGGGGGYSAGGAFNPVGGGGGYSAGGAFNPVGGGGGIPSTMTLNDARTLPELLPVPRAAGLQDEEVPVPASHLSANNNLSQKTKKLRSEILCDEPKVKYIMLRTRKLSGTGTEELMEEVDEVDHPSPVEATASPFEVKDLNDGIERNEATNNEDESRPQSASQFIGDAKCNNKLLQDLILENMVKDDALASKRAIHDASIRRFPDSTVDIVCSGTGFTYLVSTTEHCEAQINNVICFVYRRPLLR